MSDSPWLLITSINALKKCTEKCVAHFVAYNFIMTTAKLFEEYLILLEVYTVMDSLSSLDKANKITQALIVSVNAITEIQGSYCTTGEERQE